jgi:hypothetical protein
MGDGDNIDVVEEKFHAEKRKKKADSVEDCSTDCK